MLRISTGFICACLLSFAALFGNAEAALLATRITGIGSLPSDYFGVSVSLYGDQLVVGSTNSTTARNGLGGIVYSFQRSAPGVWTQTASFSGRNSGSSSYYAFSGVEVFGNSLIVSANYSNVNGNGAAYVYDRNYGGENAWGERAYLQDPGPNLLNRDFYGNAVAIDSTLAIVGAPLNDDVKTDGGRLYVYGKNVGGANKWGLIAEKAPNDVSANSRFGYAVSQSGSLAVVGAPGDSALAPGAGAAYVMQLNSSGAPSQLTKLTPPDLSTIEDFGREVEISGRTIMVSGREKGTFANVISIYEQTTLQPSAWTLATTLTLPDAGSMALDGDRFVLGAFGYSQPGKFPGGVYLYERNPLERTQWRRTAILTVPDTINSGAIGADVAIHGKTIVATNILANGETGEAYVFEIPEPRSVWLLLASWAVMLRTLSVSRLADFYSKKAS